jgi:Na+/proline symporter
MTLSNDLNVMPPPVRTLTLDLHCAGYFIVIGLGLVFSLLTSGMVWLDEKFGGASNTSENFSTAGRSIKMGLTACDIVSKWTWAATLLQSSNVAWQYGVSGPFWYASGEHPHAPSLCHVIAVTRRRVFSRATSQQGNH